MKTQAELDAAVIEAAEAWERNYTNDDTLMQNHSVRVNLWTAVRARREAMRPHKAALLYYVEAHWYRGSAFDEKDAKRRWSAADNETKAQIRGALDIILAAPDEAK